MIWRELSRKEYNKKVALPEGTWVRIERYKMVSISICCPTCKKHNIEIPILNPFFPKAPKWSFTEENGIPTFYPSIKRMTSECRSHFYLTKGVFWFAGDDDTQK